jgi:hypothetical protein
MGMSPAEIVSTDPTITLSEVHAALAYDFENREAIDAAIREGQVFCSEAPGGTALDLREVAATECHERFASTWMRTAIRRLPTA